jgi:hypothetical protein
MSMKKVMSASGLLALLAVSGAQVGVAHGQTLQDAPSQAYSEQSYAANGAGAVAGGG